MNFACLSLWFLATAQAPQPGGNEECAIILEGGPVLPIGPNKTLPDLLAELDLPADNPLAFLDLTPALTSSTDGDGVNFFLPGGRQVWIEKWEWKDGRIVFTGNARGVLSRLDGWLDFPIGFRGFVEMENPSRGRQAAALSGVKVGDDASFIRVVFNPEFLMIDLRPTAYVLAVEPPTTAFGSDGEMVVLPPEAVVVSEEKCECCNGSGSCPDMTYCDDSLRCEPPAPDVGDCERIYTRGSPAALAAMPVLGLAFLRVKGGRRCGRRLRR